MVRDNDIGTALNYRTLTKAVIVPVFNEGDQLTYYIGIQGDVTPEVEARQRVRELESEVQQLREQLAALQR